MNKKFICAVLALTSAVSMSLCSCGESGEDNTDAAATTPATTTTAAAADDGADTNEAADDNNDAPAEENDVPLERMEAEAYADKLFGGIEFVDQISPIAPEMVEKLYGISADMYVSGKVYISGMATAEEIACFDAVDENAAAEIKAALETRIDSQITSFQDYNPKEVDKLRDPVLEVRDNSVYMCISNDNATALGIIG